MVSVSEIIKHDGHFIHLWKANSLMHLILVNENHFTPYCCFAFITLLFILTYDDLYDSHIQIINITWNVLMKIILSTFDTLWYITMILCDKVVCVNSQVPGGQKKIPYKHNKDMMPNGWIKIYCIEKYVQNWKTWARIYLYILICSSLLIVTKSTQGNYYM